MRCLLHCISISTMKTKMPKKKKITLHCLRKTSKNVSKCWGRTFSPNSFCWKHLTSQIYLLFQRAPWRYSTISSFIICGSYEDSSEPQPTWCLTQWQQLKSMGRRHSSHAETGGEEEPSRLHTQHWLMTSSGQGPLRSYGRKTKVLCLQGLGTTKELLQKALNATQDWW